MHSANINQIKWFSIFKFSFM